MASEQRKPEFPLQCANNCGFFGSSSTLNMCSKCYRDYTNNQNLNAAAESAIKETLEVKPEPTLSSTSKPYVSMFKDCFKNLKEIAPESTLRSTSKPYVSMFEDCSKKSKEIAPESTLRSTSRPYVSMFKDCSKTFKELAEESLLRCAKKPKVSLCKWANTASVSNSDSDDVQRKSRCAVCNKKFGLLGFRCRCGSDVCSMHRYPEKHQCTFDYKALGREEIARANPLVKASKLEKI